MPCSRCLHKRCSIESNIWSNKRHRLSVGQRAFYSSLGIDWPTWKFHEHVFSVVLAVQRVSTKTRVSGPADRDTGIDRFLTRGASFRSSPEEAQRRETRLSERKSNRRSRFRTGTSEEPGTQEAFGCVTREFKGTRKGKLAVMWRLWVVLLKQSCFSTMKQNTLLHLFCASYSFQSVMLKKGYMVSIASSNGDFHENLLQKIIIFVIVTLVFYFPFNYRYTCDRVIQTKCQYFSLRFSNEIIQFSRYILLLLFYFS